MKIISADISGSLIINNTDVTQILVSSSVWSGSLNQRVSNLESTASVLTAASGTLDTRVGSLETTSSILTAASGTLNTRVGSLETTASILTQASGTLDTRSTRLESTASILTAASGTLNTRVVSLESTASILTAASGTLNTRVVSLESTASVLTAASASLNAGLTNVIATTGSFATTGSNTFTGIQYFSSIANANSFTATGSFYSDGGMRVTRDMYVSGTAYFNNVVVYGTQSINFITASQLNISTNIITVNTDTPTIRFGGLAVYDSGSSALSGSILWDSEANHWVYSNPSGSTYNGGMLISGPRNLSGLGCEQGTTACALMMGQGGDHITSSAIFHYSNATCFYGASHITCTGLVCGNVANFKCVGVGTTSPGAALDVRSPFTQVANFRYNSGASANTELTVINTSNPSNGVVMAHMADGTGLFGSQNATALRFVTDNTERMRFAGSGEACFRCQVCAPSFIGGTVSGTTGAFSSYVDGFGIRANNSSAFGSTGVGVELGWNGSLGYVQSYNRSTSAYQPMTVAGCTIALNISGNERFTMFSTGVSCFTCTVCAPAFVGSNANFNADFCYTSTGDISFTGKDANSKARFTGANASGQLGLFRSGTSQGGVYLGADSDLFRIYKSDFSSALMILSSTTGIACFAGNVCTPNLVVNSTTSCVNINRTDGTPAVLQLGNTSNSYQIQYTCTGGQRLAFINGAPTEYASFFGTGVACFSGTVCAPNIGMPYSSNVYWNSTSNQYITADSSYLYLGTGNLSRLKIDTNGIACFACQVCAPKYEAKAGVDGDEWFVGRGSSNSSKMIRMYQSSGDGYIEVRTGADAIITKLSGYSGTPSYFCSNVAIGMATPQAILDVSHTAGTTNIIRVSCGYGNYRWRVDQNFAMIMTNASGTDTFSVTTAGTVTTPSTITVNSRTVLSGGGIYDNASSGNNVGIYFGATGIIPTDGGGNLANGTKDLGSASYRWCTVYTSDLSLNNGIGNYTIVEGENDLFLYNNNSCKVFKFLLQEVCPEIAPAKRSI